MLRFLRTQGKRTRTIWWVLIGVTVVTFLGGFVFLLGSGLDSSNRARASGAVGTVEGSAISRTEYLDAIADQRENWRRQYGVEPGERDLKMIEVQAWRSVTLQRLMNRQASAVGIGATDHEVVVSLKNNPPPAVMSSPAFQTDGKFDVKKYQDVMMNPNNVAEVARLEDLTRRQLPVRKLQERLLSSLKFTEPELLETYQSRFERLSATVLMVPGASDAKLPPPGDADLDRIYQKHRGRFSAGPRTQLEVLIAPKDFGDEEVRTSRDLAQSLVTRARRGEDFASLARDYSEGPGAEKGGEIDRLFQVSDFGPEIGPKVAMLDTGQVTDTVRDGGRFMVIKLLRHESAPSGAPGLRVAQIVVRIRPNDDRRRAQYKSLVGLRNQAVKIGLGKAATARGLSTAMTQFYDASNTPNELFNEPEVSDWGLGAKKGAVSAVFEGIDEFVIAQVAGQSEAGPAPKDQVGPQVRQLAQLEAEVERAKPKADAVAADLKAGKSIEQAAAAQGFTTSHLEGTSRYQPDQSLVNAPEFVGALFGARPGQTVGPIRAINGWYFGRVEQHVPADTTLLQQVRNQLSSDLLQHRQQSFLNGYFSKLRLGAKVQDLRNEGTNQ